MITNSADSDLGMAISAHLPLKGEAVGGVRAAFDLKLPHSCHSWCGRTVKFIITFTRINVIAFDRLHISEISIHNSF